MSVLRIVVMALGGYLLFGCLHADLCCLMLLKVCRLMPFRLLIEALGHCFAYFWGPGTASCRRLPYPSNVVPRALTYPYCF